MKAKKWITIFLIVGVMSVVSLNLVNYVVDPFNVFQTPFLKHQYQMNERFMKVKYLEQHNKEFNGYIFGSSRIGTTYPSSVEKYIKNSKLYNFTLSNANFYDYLNHLKFFIKRQYPIHTLYLQIDINSMSKYGAVASDYLRKPHPYVMNSSLMLYYMDYLNGLFPLSLKGKILKNINPTSDMNYFIENGMWTKPNSEKEIQNEYLKYEKRVWKGKERNQRKEIYSTSDQSMGALSEIIKLCKANNIKLYVFTTPHNQHMMDTFVVEDYLHYLKDIAQLTEFYDFTGYNSVTTNNFNYYEKSHYRPHLGDWVAGRIFNDKSIEIPEDFGVLVNQENIKSHIENLKNQINKYELYYND